MDAVIDQLLQIKEFREEKAQLEVNRARRVLDEADSALQKAKDHLDAHRNECVRKERAMYAELCTRQVRLWDLQSAALTVEELKQSIQACVTRVSDASEQRDTSAKGLGEARRLHEEAIRKREKFTELRTLSQADEQQEAARMEDAEMEEVPVKAPEQEREPAR